MKMNYPFARITLLAITMLLRQTTMVRVCTLFRVTTVQVKGRLWVVWMIFHVASLAPPHQMIQRCAIIRSQATIASIQTIQTRTGMR